MAGHAQPEHFYALTFLAMATRCAAYMVLGKRLHDSDKRTRPRASFWVPWQVLLLAGTRGELELPFSPFPPSAHCHHHDQPHGTRARRAARVCTADEQRAGN